jgi:hypothetical protein
MRPNCLQIYLALPARLLNLKSSRHSKKQSGPAILQPKAPRKNRTLHQFSAWAGSAASSTPDC